MTVPQNDWLHKIALAIIIAVVLFVFKAQWSAVEALQVNLADHREDAAKSFVTRQEMIQVIREIIRNAPR